MKTEWNILIHSLVQQLCGVPIMCQALDIRTQWWIMKSLELDNRLAEDSLESFWHEKNHVLFSRLMHWFLGSHLLFQNTYQGINVTLSSYQEETSTVKQFSIWLKGWERGASTPGTGRLLFRLSGDLTAADNELFNHPSLVTKSPMGIKSSSVIKNN